MGSKYLSNNLKGDLIMKLLETKHVTVEARKTTTKEKIEATIVILLVAGVIYWKVFH